MAMRARCSNTKLPTYKYYGGRGIKVCARWESFENFLEDMGRRPSPKHSIERKDVNGDYMPENCVWATPKEQGANKRDNHYLSFGGERLHLTEVARIAGLKPSTLRMRLRSGLSLEEALERGNKKTEKHK